MINVTRAITRLAAQFAALTLSEPALLLCPVCEIEVERCQCDEHQKVIQMICEWFLLCKREATQTRPHPVLGAVPVCDQCASFVDSNTRKD